MYIFKLIVLVLLPTTLLFSNCFYRHRSRQWARQHVHEYPGRDHVCAVHINCVVVSDTEILMTFNELIWMLMSAGFVDWQLFASSTLWGDNMSILFTLTFFQGYYIEFLVSHHYHFIAINLNWAVGFVYPFFLILWCDRTRWSSLPWWRTHTIMQMCRSIHCQEAQL